MKRVMTLKEWKEQLGHALSVSDAAMVLGEPALNLARAAGRGELKVHRFDAVDGRQYTMIRVDDLLDYRKRRPGPVKLTPQMMRRAFARVLSSPAGSAKKASA